MGTCSSTLPNNIPDNIPDIQLIVSIKEKPELLIIIPLYNSANQSPEMCFEKHCLFLPYDTHCMKKHLTVEFLDDKLYNILLKT